MDCDIETALYLAQLEHRFGVSSAYYLLHSAAYYSCIEGSKLETYSGIIQIAKALQALGHEIGIHNDALKFCLENRWDGIRILKSEVKWLQKNGIEVAGSATHNSEDSYGAANWEIFRDVQVPYRPREIEGCVREGGKVTFQSVHLPVGEETLRSCGLEYDAETLRLERKLHFEAWLWGRDQWSWWELDEVVDTKRPWNYVDVTHAELLNRIRSLPNGSVVTLMVHPVYYCEYSADDLDSLGLSSSTELVEKEYR
ncbi:MAG: hypothetical protein WD342_00770 [Verrucomicrobiales bacterium]